MPQHRQLRLYPLLVLAGLVLLPACQSTAPTHAESAETKAEQAQARTQFVADFQAVLRRDMAQANHPPLVGALSLQVTLDRQNRPLACKVVRTKLSLLTHQPPGTPTSYSQELADLVIQQCWKSVYPLVPVHMFGQEDTVDILAPLFMMPADNAEGLNPYRRVHYAQRDFFWQHLMREQPVNSIGLARILYRANAQGKVQDCIVNLHPDTVRADAFEVDGALQDTLKARCKTLDLHAMPGFILNDQGVAEGSVAVGYAPWKVGRP